jgi:hypothetical protein
MSKCRMLTNEFCVRGKFWEKDPHTHSPPPLSVVGVSNRQSLNQEQSTGVDSWEKLSFAHHPCTEKKGIRIYRSINTEVTTVDRLLADCSGVD